MFIAQGHEASVARTQTSVKAEYACAISHRIKAETAGANPADAGTEIQIWLAVVLSASLQPDDGDSFVDGIQIRVTP